MTVPQPDKQDRRSLLILIFGSLMFLAGHCSGQEKKARQHLVVRIPGAVQVTQTASSASSGLDVRIQTSGDIVVAVAAESPSGRTGRPSDSVLILHSGHKGMIRFRSEPDQTGLDPVRDPSVLDYRLPSGQRAVLTVSAL